MNAWARSSGRSLATAVRIMVIFTLVLGVAYPLTLVGVGQVVFPWQANGSILMSDGVRVGSALIGQSFTDADGKPLAVYFQSRPSSAGDGYDARASVGSNLGPENEALIAAIAERKAQIADFNGVAQAEVPADAVTASGSGLDPHISTAYALVQAGRVAGARGLSVDEVRSLIDAHTQNRDLGYLGQPRVNVLELNLALDDRKE